MAHAPNLLTADGRPLELSAAQQQLGRDLLELLKPGMVMHGRVAERFANNQYLFVLRGRNLIAESAIPLARDSVVAFEVLSTKGSLQIRLQQVSTADHVITSAPAERLRALALPDTPQARLVLNTFIQHRAPLEPARLQLALQAMTTMATAQVKLPSAAAEISTQEANPAQVRIANAHAVLALQQLPPTPLFLQLATRVLHGGLPAPVLALQQALRTNSPQAQPQAQQRPELRSTPQPAPLVPPPEPPAQPVVPVLAAPGSAAKATNPETPPGSPPPAPQLGAALPSLLARLLGFAAPQAEAAMRTASGSVTTPQAPPSPAHVAPIPLQEHQRQESHRPLQAPSASQLLEILEQQDSARRSTAQFLQHHADAALTTHWASESSAETLLPPRDLGDYDLVLPLALPPSAAESAVPARLAVAHRRVRGGGQAHWLRVDVEMHTLGPVSIRLSSLDQGPLAILLHARLSSLPRLESAVPALIEDLSALGLHASVRLEAWEGSEHDDA